MTHKELLNRRYKVIADYPPDPCPFKVGHIIIFDAEAAWHLDETGKQIWMNPSHYNSSYWISQHIKPDQYPHLFKKLEWWEDRKEEDMPEYVKFDGDGEVVKVNKHYPLRGSFIHTSDTKDFYTWVAPATEEEYKNQKIKNL